jgi:putative transposase
MVFMAIDASMQNFEHRALLAGGIAAKLMRHNGIRVRTRKRWRPVSGGQHLLPVAPNLLQRQFAADNLNQRWVSDMTYIRTGEGWLYLAVVLGLSWAGQCITESSKNWYMRP